MQINNIIFTLITSTLLGGGAVHALKVDPDAVDGLYAILKDAKGVEFVKLLEPLNSTKAEAESLSKRISIDAGLAANAKLTKRESLGCTGRSMIASECDGAVGALQSYCGGGRSFPYAKTYWKVGNAYAYMCDYWGAQLCYASEDGFANDRLTANCGRYRTGWYYNNGKTYGYDYSWDGNVHICENM